MGEPNGAVIAAVKSTLDAFASALGREFAALLIDPDAELAAATWIRVLKGRMNSLRDVTGWPILLIVPAKELAKGLGTLAGANGPLADQLLAAHGMPVVVIGPDGVSLHDHRSTLMSKGGQA